MAQSKKRSGKTRAEKNEQDSQEQPQTQPDEQQESQEQPQTQPEEPQPDQPEPDQQPEQDDGEESQEPEKVDEPSPPVQAEESQEYQPSHRPLQNADLDQHAAEEEREAARQAQRDEHNRRVAPAAA